MSAEGLFIALSVIISAWILLHHFNGGSLLLLAAIELLIQLNNAKQKNERMKEKKNGLISGKCFSFHLPLTAKIFIGQYNCISELLSNFTNDCISFHMYLNSRFLLVNVHTYAYTYNILRKISTCAVCWTVKEMHCVIEG